MRCTKPLTTQQALSQVEELARACRVLDLNSLALIEGCRGVVQHGLSIWDALIWAGAKINQVRYVLTEDSPHGHLLEGIRFLNPFAPSFDLAGSRLGL